MSQNNFDFSAKGVLALLRSQGLRVTRSRKGIMEALFKAPRPLSLTEIQQSALAEGGMLPDYATVFRMVTLLESMNLVHKVNLKRSCTYYELTNPAQHYDHVVCTDCGSVQVLEIPCPVSDVEALIESEMRFTGVHHSLEFFGHCAECSAKLHSTFEQPAPVAA